MVLDGSLKLGFRTHYPQIETKLPCAAPIWTRSIKSSRRSRRKSASLSAIFILGEDDQTLEGVVLAELTARGGWLAGVETFAVGQIAARIAHLPSAEKVFRRGLVARETPPSWLRPSASTEVLVSGEMSRETAEKVAQAIRRETAASHALAVLIEVGDGPDRIEFGGSIHLAIAGPEEVESRRSRIYGGRDWVRLGPVELGLDCLRRYLQGLPVTERTDFERV